MDIGSVPGEIGILPEYREGYRNPPGAKWAMMGLSGKEKRQPYMGCAPPSSPSPIRTRRLGEVAGPLSLFSPSANPIPTRIGGESYSQRE